MYQFIHPFGNIGILTSAGLDLAEGVKSQAELKLRGPVSHSFLLEKSKGFPYGAIIRFSAHNTTV